MEPIKPKKALKMLAALSQETRLEVFRLLVKQGPEGLSAGTIAEMMVVPSATMSFHLSQLASAGLLKSRKEGRAIYYSAKYKSIKNLLKYITEDAYKKKHKHAVIIESNGKGGRIEDVDSDGE